MCKSLSKYKCGKCYSCLAEKRNSLMIRLTEEYDGIYRNFKINQYAVLFGMLTFSDDFLPSVNFNNDIVCNWTPLIQKFIKRFRKDYPFLQLKYFIGGEFGANKTQRFHCHPVFFITPNYDILCNELSYSRSRNIMLQKRFTQCVRSLLDANTYNISSLRKRGKVSDVNSFTAFERYCFNALRNTWYYGLLDLKPVLNARAIKYCTKYILKSQDDRFARVQRILHPFWLPSKRVYSRANLKGDKSFPSWDKRVIHKQYLISNGIGDAFFNTPQYHHLIDNLLLITDTIHYVSKFDGKNLIYNDFITVKFNKPLRWSDSNNIGFTTKNSYSLPLKYKYHIYDNYCADLESRYRLGELLQLRSVLIGYNKLASLCLSNNIPFEIKALEECGVVYDFEFILSSPDKNKLNKILSDNYNKLKTFKMSALCL